MRKFLIICNILCLFSMFITELFGKDEPKITKWEIQDIRILIDKEWNEILKKKSALTQEESKKLYESIIILDKPLGKQTKVMEPMKNKLITNIRQMISQEYVPNETGDWLIFYQNPIDNKVKDFYVAYKVNNSRFIIKGQCVGSEISCLELYADDPFNFIEINDVLKITPKSPPQKKELKIIEAGELKTVKSIRVNVVKTNKFVGF